MRLKFFPIFIPAMALSILFFAAEAFGVENQAPGAPSAYFPENSYIF
jgi:hypothetical protein